MNILVATGIKGIEFMGIEQSDVDLLESVYGKVIPECEGNYLLEIFSPYDIFRQGGRYPRRRKKIITRNYKKVRFDDLPVEGQNSFPRFDREALVSRNGEVIVFFGEDGSSINDPYYVDANNTRYINEFDFYRLLENINKQMAKKENRIRERKEEEASVEGTFDRYRKRKEERPNYIDGIGEIVPPRSNFSYNDWGDYSFEEELAQVRMERLDEERILPYSLGRLRDAYKRALARLHILKSTPGSDPAEISHIEEFIDKAVHKMARMKKRLDWYERARVEESRDEPIEEPWHSVNEFDRGADFSTVDEES